MMVKSNKREQKVSRAMLQGLARVMAVAIHWFSGPLERKQFFERNAGWCNGWFTVGSFVDGLGRLPSDG